MALSIEEEIEECLSELNILDRTVEQRMRAIIYNNIQHGRWQYFEDHHSAASICDYIGVIYTNYQEHGRRLYKIQQQRDDTILQELLTELQVMARSFTNKYCRGWSLSRIEDLQNNIAIDMMLKILGPATYYYDNLLIQWLKTILHHTGTDLLRKELTKQAKYENEHHSLEDESLEYLEQAIAYRKNRRQVEELVSANEDHERQWLCYLEAVDYLPAAQSAVWNAIAVEGLKRIDVAEKLVISRNTLDQRYFQAKKNLMKYIKNNCL